ncbi:PIG-L deacetylase family protein [Calidifontibacter terrae]
MSYTLVAFHAHPDDEALLTSGTMAKAAAAGHRVVLVVATDGALGLAAGEFRDDGGLGARRLTELQRSADALGVARVEHLGYADSGMAGDAPPNAFVDAPVDEAAERLAAILREEEADVLLTYECNGGYGHRDHVRAHLVGLRAGAAARTPRVLQATVPRDLLVGALKAVSKVYSFPDAFDMEVYERSFSARSQITHRINVLRQAGAKRASMRAHASQATADDGDRTLAAFLRIPRPLFDLTFGREWYLEAGHTGPVARDVFQGLP